MQIPQGVTLRIDPGVEIDLNGWFIQVDGLLRAKGTVDSPISFSGYEQSEGGNKLVFGPTAVPWSGSEESGGIVEHATFRGIAKLGMVVVNGSAPKLSYLDVSNDQHSGIDLSGSAWLVNSRICNNDIFGVMVREDSSPLIESNVICQNGEVGVYLTSEASHPVIVNNGIYENGVTGSEFGAGIRIDGSSTTIRLNRIYGNLIGVLMCCPRSVGNIRFEQNSVTDNRAFPVRMHDWNVDVQMSDNWWGTTDVNGIESSIHDQGVDFRLGQVIVNPILSGPPNG